MENLANDLLAGARQIADETGFTVRKVYYLAESGQIPTFKLGGRMHARRSELSKALSAEIVSHLVV